MTLLARAAWPLQTGIQSKREPSVWQNFGEARAGRVRHKQAEACRRTPTKTIQNKASTASQAKPSQAQMGQRFSGHSLQADTHEVEKSRSNPAYPNAMINARCKFCRHKLYPNTRIPLSKASTLIWSQIRSKRGRRQRRGQHAQARHFHSTSTQALSTRRSNRFRTNPL